MATPDSVPSLSALSSASDDPGDVKRALFQTPESECNKRALSYSRSEEDETDSLFGSDIISEASENLASTDKVSRAHYIAPLLMPTTTQNLTKERAESSNQLQPACHSALGLSRSEFTEMFSMFGMNKKPSTLSQDLHSPNSMTADLGTPETDAITEVTSNVDHSVISWDRKIDSLERECATLKDIIKSDSVRILQLRTELSTLRGNGPAIDSPTQKQVDALKLEKDALLRRESLHLETIKTLKHELKELVKKENNTNPAIPKELEQLRLENELLASQIVENEAELHALETENLELRGELAKHQSGVHVTSTSRQEEAQSESGSSRIELRTQVASLFAKIAEIESERDRRDKAFADDSRQTHEELESIKTMILEPKISPPKFEKLQPEANETPCAEEYEVEVTLEGEIITANSMLDEKENDPNTTPQNQKRDTSEDGDVFCDCFPTFSFHDD